MRRQLPPQPYTCGRRRSQGGFTLLEILIATAILVVGLVGVLALFPAGIKVGDEVVQESTAITLARSVADSIRKGLRNNLRARSPKGGITYSYFVFQHDGVTAAPSNRAKERPSENYYILLPRHVPGRAIARKGEMSARQRAAIGDRGKTFVYPETDDLPNGRGDPFRADNDSGEPVVAVYEFGSTMPSMDAEGPQYLDDQKIEVLKQYSYAFSIRSSIYDPNMDPAQGRTFIPGDELYHVRVMIFRAFESQYREGGEPVEPLFELDFEVAK